MLDDLTGPSDRIKSELRRRLIRLSLLYLPKYQPSSLDSFAGEFNIERPYTERTVYGEEFVAVERIRLTRTRNLNPPHLRLAHFKNGVRLVDICLIDTRDAQEDFWTTDSAVDVALPMLQRYMVLDDIGDV